MIDVLVVISFGVQMVTFVLLVGVLLIVTSR